MSPPVVIGDRASKAAALVVCPVPPFAKGNAVPLRDTASVPLDVTGEPAIDRKDGTVIATDVTVPLVAGGAHAGTPPATVNTLPVDPTASLWLVAPIGL